MSVQSISSSDLSESEELSFIKTDQERLLKNSNIIKQDEQSSNICQKHPNKKAKFYIQNNNTQLFCSKCALNLALKGLKIEETQELQLELQRKNKITKFQNELLLVMNLCDTKLQELLDMEIIINQQVEEQKLNCQIFFDTLANTINQLKQTYEQKFQNDQQQFIQQIQESLRFIKQLTIQLNQYKDDIKQNHDNIVKKMEMKPFDDIMNKYQKKVDDTKNQLQNCIPQYIQKIIIVDSNLILTQMNKLCYNMLIKNDTKECNENLKTITSTKNLECSTQKQLRIFEINENEDIQSPISSLQNQLSSPNRQNFPKMDSLNSNPIRSGVNTPESWKQQTYFKRENLSPNDRRSCQNSSRVIEQVSSKKVLHKQLNDKITYQYNNEKQKTSTEYERGSDKSVSRLNNNLSCYPIQKYIKEVERGSLEERESTPKQQKIKPSTKFNISNIQTKNLSSQKLQQTNSIQKHQFGSVPNLKSLAYQQNELLFLNKQQDNQSRSKSKQKSKPQSIDFENKRQFISNTALTQVQATQNEETLKDKIFKELCSHPADSVYNQVLKTQIQRSKNNNKVSKENYDWTTTRNKSNGQNVNKKQY